MIMRISAGNQLEVFSYSSTWTFANAANSRKVCVEDNMQFYIAYKQYRGDPLQNSWY